MPKEREEDLWHDTIPPGGVEGKSPGQIPQGPTAELKATRPGVPPRVLDLTPEEAAVLKKGKLRRVGAIALISVLFGGALAFFVARDDGSKKKATTKAPTVETEMRDVKNADRGDHPDTSNEANVLPATETPPASESQPDNLEEPAKPKAAAAPHANAELKKPSPKVTKPSIKPIQKTPPDPTTKEVLPFGGK